MRKIGGWGGAAAYYHCRSIDYCRSQGNSESNRGFSFSIFLINVQFFFDWGGASIVLSTYQENRIPTFYNLIKITEK
jgi:hypothetical protein